MAITYIYYDDTAAGLRLSSDAWNADVYIDSGAVLGSTDGTAIHVKGMSSDVFVRGTVMGFATGISLGDSYDDYGNSVHIAEGGAVWGNHAVATQGSAKVFNKGDIDAPSIGVFLRMDTSDSSTVANDGMISAGNYGIYAELGDSSSFTITNHGAISGEYYGARLAGDTDSSSRLTNYGTIESQYYAYYGGGGADRLVNRGQLLGLIEMGSGNDIFDNRGGHVEEAVQGGYGDDIFIPGAEIEEFFGGEGIDTLDFRASTGLRVSLVNGSGTGRAQADVYTGFERILGSRDGKDTLIGDDNANTLEGLGGRDVLQSAAGDDRLVGGLGSDQITGGLGNDVLVFTRIAEGGDVIRDFRNAVGNNDVFHIAVGGFGGGLTAGALAPTQLVKRTDNLAQDADDRFVFRTTDRTLWFDGDGKGGAAAVLLADLQDNATINSADILLV